MWQINKLEFWLESKSLPDRVMERAKHTAEQAEEISTGILAVFVDMWQFAIITVDDSSITVGTLTVGLILMILGVYLSKFLSRRLVEGIQGRIGLDVSSRHTIQTFTFYFFTIIFSLFAMRMANLPITIFTLIGGALAIGIGFGSQNIINNFISGIIMMVERPIKVGDYVEIADCLGVITNIGMRSTHIQSFGRKNIIVPNSAFLEQNVTNWTHRQKKIIRLEVDVGVSYDSDVQKVKKLLQVILKENKVVLSNKFKSEVLITQFGDSSVDFRLYFWIRLNAIIDIERVKSDIRFTVFEVFKQNDISIPYPHRQIVTTSPAKKKSTTRKKKKILAS